MADSGQGLSRRFLDRIYDGCGAIAAIFLILIAVMVTAQIVTRVIGVSLPGTDDLAGYAMASSAFFGLAHTFRKGAHIRVTLVLARMSPNRRRLGEMLALGISAAVLLYLFGYAVLLAWESAILGAVSTGLLPIPTWIPQSFMAIGVGVILLALIDSLAVIILGGPPVYELASGAGD